MIIISANLKKRIISASLIAPIILWIIATGGIAFSILMILLAVLMSYEWKDLIAHHQADQHRTGWHLAGIAYIVLPLISLQWLRSLDDGLIIVFWLLFAVWATDIAAYFAGRAIGGLKLAPSISPNKTWAGLGGGVLAATLIGAIAALFSDSAHPLLLIFISGSLAVVAQIGDLFESWVKRFFGVKDSGHLLPGHGGILDRVDGILSVAPAVALLILLGGEALF